MKRGRGAPAGRPGGPITFDGETANQPAEWAVAFRGPNATINGTYVEGANTAHVTRTDAGFVRMIIDLHKVVGVNLAFILLMDALAGAMMFMSLSGIVLWTRCTARAWRPSASSRPCPPPRSRRSGAWVSWAAP